MTTSGCSSNHAFVCEGGVLWAFGDNSAGQLGVGDRENRLVPALVPFEGPFIRQIATGAEHSLLLDEEGHVRGAGSAFHGHPEGPLFVRMLQQPKRMIVVAAGGWHSAAIDEEGSLWTWAQSDRGTTSGQLGIGTLLLPEIPQRVSNLPPVVQVHCGWNFTFAETSDGELWSFGQNGMGMLGLGHENNVLEATRVSISGLPSGRLRSVAAILHSTVLVDSQGGLWITGGGVFGDQDSSMHFHRVSFLPSLHLVVAGCDHFIAQDEMDEVWGWGSSAQGQLGIGDPAVNGPQIALPRRLPWFSGALQITTGSYSTYVTMSNGQLHVAGENGLGQLGMIDPLRLQLPVHFPIASTLRPDVTFKEKRPKSALSLATD